MQIECPSCGAAYEVPDQILARKRIMRCARCARDWSPASALEVAPPPAPPAAPAVVPQAPPVIPRQAAAPPRVSARRKAAVLGAWAASLALLAGAGWWGIAARARVVHAWPASERAYAALGMRAGE